MSLSRHSYPSGWLFFILAKSCVFTQSQDSQGFWGCSLRQPLKANNDLGDFSSIPNLENVSEIYKCIFFLCFIAYLMQVLCIWDIQMYFFNYPTAFLM